MTYLGGGLDPSRHDAATLHEFCTNHEVPEVGGGFGGGFGGFGGGGGGASAANALNMDAEKQGLVDRIKAFTKGGPENKEAWCGYCGPTKDPARHATQKL